MVDIKSICDCLIENGVDFYTGVPDSYLNGFCNYILNNYPERNIIAANEGNAIAIAAGHYLASQKIPLVYMQNSGVGNAINPLASLVDENVYNLPMLLLIGWRGQPGTDDWPQHICQGNSTIGLLNCLGISCEILGGDQNRILDIIKNSIDIIKESNKPYALVVPKGVFSGEKENERDDRFPLNRSEAIEIILDVLPKDTFYIATTGRATRELFYLREKRNEKKDHDFLNVGAMGHASSIALGMALEKPNKQFVVLDGDSSCIMHMGAMTTVGKCNVPNYLHIVLNNGAHESVGGQPSAGFVVNFTEIARACGYITPSVEVIDKVSLINACEQMSIRTNAGFIDVKIHKGLCGKLPPLKFDHRNAADDLMRQLSVRDGFY